MMRAMRDLALAAAAVVCVWPAPAHADEMHDALEAYALYQNDVSTLLDTDINRGNVDAALSRLQRHDSERVARGWIAYGALTAAQSPASLPQSATASARVAPRCCMHSATTSLTHASNKARPPFN